MCENAILSTAPACVARGEGHRFSPRTYRGLIFEWEPYGAYHCRDHVTLFNRNYAPIVTQWSNGRVEAADDSIWHNALETVHFYDDGCSPGFDLKTRQRIREINDRFSRGESLDSILRRQAARVTRARLRARRARLGLRGGR